ncbi:RNA modification enzyme, MiaB family [uncultured delta proteobacterium]|uniref:RNA modification enzyme, MiaB family n=1 Tax=uncultured delta proteobacterium TaxID=34034 RepID=A0A212JJH1_9DELT|nr:RNA modification enzyme, MiaB family [uncultured delta proteobacterium]
MVRDVNDDTFFLVTLGCKVNQYESQALREAWAARGLIAAESAKDAATVCISTCAVTAGAVADGRAAVRRVHRENPDAAIIVTGCAAQVMPGEFQKLPGVTRVVPQQNKMTLLRYGEDASCEREGFCGASGGVQGSEGGGPQRDTETPPYPPFTITEYDRSRAIVKVQDGCSHRCTYCIVPLTRGTSRSRLPEATLDEAKRLLKAGFRELVLNGINLAQYGRDFAHEHDFWDLVAFLEAELAPEWAGCARIRLSSLEPGQLGPKALDVLGRSLLVAPHLHLSLQSGAKNVLRRMGRGHYDPDILHGFCAALGEKLPRFGLGADILTGFPGETEEDAATTEAFCAALPFSYAHVFPYSRRPGTPAAAWRDQVDSGVKKERAARLRAIFDAKSRRFLEDSLALPVVRVACEVSGEGAARTFSGVDECYVECRFMKGHEPDASRSRSLVAAKPEAAGDGWLWVKSLE